MSKTKEIENMTVTKEEFIEAVRKYNERNEDAYLGILTELFVKKAAKTTLQKMMWELIEDGKLIGKSKEGPRGTRRCLYVPELCDEENTSDDRVIIEIRKDVKNIMDFLGLTPELCECVRKQRQRRL